MARPFPIFKMVKWPSRLGAVTVALRRGMAPEPAHSHSGENSEESEGNQFPCAKEDFGDFGDWQGRQPAAAGDSRAPEQGADAPGGRKGTLAIGRPPEIG